MRRAIGILAHVDAGKTTLSERVLYESRVIREPGRVDHGDTFLDTDPTERRRGITIYAGVARLEWDGDTVWWLDTPGHSDFTAETERALAVMDDAVLVVNSADGVQSHTETLWHLLRSYAVPTFIFLSKTDLAAADPDRVLADLRRRVSSDMLDLRAWQRDGRMDRPLLEEIALREETLIPLLEEDDPPQAPFEEALIRLIRAEAVFPVMAGAALRGEGVPSFMRLLHRLTPVTGPDDGPLRAVCWKTLHDARGQKLSVIRILGGRLRIRDTLPLAGGEQKLTEMFSLSGSRYRRIEEAEAGDMAVLAGIDGLKTGDAIGDAAPLHGRLSPMMASDVLWEEPATQREVLRALRILEEEEPTLSVETRRDAVSVRVMGSIQLEILQTVMRERFSLAIRFGPFRVLYRETVAAPAVGIGHYEPLRHYAEVWLRLVPLPEGSGIRFRSLTHVDDLPLHWQRLIETHVFEREHRGVLTGSPLTDTEVQLLCGRAHLKHTEGGDFRQATCRAVRNALMQAESRLLEPIAAFELRVPAEMLGGVLSSLRATRAEVNETLPEDDWITLRGEAPFALFRAWQDGFAALTRGRGSLKLHLSRYAPCHNEAEVVAAAAYNPLEMPEDTPDSVFCAHGAGYTVAWDRVRGAAHCSPEAISITDSR
ncbi:MAG: TetM/TetW/TetO/TetS family tetracycline resistance ribosomal protection protein [Clostridia bacterium]|nr:TetM/TetW/TetO/TetS family tetracycline resistance ribosomal protection protein [Clostridia bacterium]